MQTQTGQTTSERALKIPFFKSAQNPTLLLAGVFLLTSVLSGFFLTRVYTPAYAAINEELNFQARLLDSTGGLVDDGNYNIQFNIYSGGDGVIGGGDETLEWTGSYLKGNSQGIDVVNGYVNAQLGEAASDMPSGDLSTVDWNNSTLWLSINIGNPVATSTTCDTTADFGTNCGGDGEMGPYIRLASTPYAFNAGQLEGRGADQFVQLNPGVTPQTVSTANTALNIRQDGAGDLINLQQGTDSYLNLDNAGALTLGAYDCSANANGGALTANASGVITCSDDDGGGGSGISVVGAIDGQPKNANGAAISGSSIFLQSADATNPGIITIGAQTIAGAKTFNDEVTIGVASTADGTLKLLNSTNAFGVTISGANQTTGDVVISFPDTGASTTDTVCLLGAGNCVGSGGSGAIGGSGTNNTIALFTPDGNNIGNSIITQSGSIVTVAGDIAVNGGDISSTESLTFTIDSDSDGSTEDFIFNTDGGTTLASINQNGSFDITTGALQFGGVSTITSGRTLRVTNGSAASPAVSFTNSTGTGLFTNGTADLGVSAGGSERLVISGTTGDVSIGGTTGDDRLEISGGNLDVNGNIETNDVTRISSTGAFTGTNGTFSGYGDFGGGVGESYINVNGDTTGSERISFQNAGSTTWSIGSIGSGATPSFSVQRYVAGAYVDTPIQVSSSTGAISLTKNTAITGGGTLSVAGLITANGGLTVGSGDAITIGGDSIQDFTGTGLTVDGSGVLNASLSGLGGVGGSGTDNTIALFTGGGTSVGDSILTQTGTTDVNVAGDINITGELVVDDGSLDITASASTGLQINTTGAAAWTNLGTTSGIDILNLYNNANTEVVTFRDNGDFAVDAQTLFVDASGNDVGINTASPNEALEVAGSGRVFIGDGGGASRSGILIDGSEGGTYTRLEAFDYGAADGIDLLINSTGGGGVLLGNNSTDSFITIGSATAGDDKLEVKGNAGTDNLDIDTGDLQLNDITRINNSGALTVTTGNFSGLLAAAGNIRINDGTEGSPAFSFISDVNTGIYSPAADQLGFSAGGSQVLRLQSDGAVVTGTIDIPGVGAGNVDFKSGYSAEWSGKIPTSGLWPTNGSDRAVAYIEIGDGSTATQLTAVEVSISGGFSTGNSTGRITKSFGYYFAGASDTILTEESQVSESYGQINERYSIGDLEVSGGKVRVPIYRLTTGTTTAVGVQVKTYSDSQVQLDGVVDNIAIINPVLGANSAVANVLSVEGEDICTTGGNCVGVGGGAAIGGSGANNTIALFTPDGNNIGNSIVTQSGTSFIDVDGVVRSDITAGQGSLEVRDNGVLSAALLDASAGGNIGYLQLYSGGSTQVSIQAAGDSYINAGNFGVGDPTPDARIDSQSTSEQLRLSYNDSNYTQFTTGATGDIQIIPSGGDVALSGRLSITNPTSGNYPLNLTSAGVTTSIGALNGTYTHLDTTATSGFYFYDRINASSGVTINGSSTLVVGTGATTLGGTLAVTDNATFSGNINVAGIGISNGTGFNRFNDLLYARNASPSVTGALVIETNIPKELTGHWISDLEFDVYQYVSGNEAAEFNLSTYNFHTDTGPVSSFPNNNVTREGSLDIGVRLAEDTTRLADVAYGGGLISIIIGDTDTAWNRPQVSVTGATSSYATESFFEDWTFDSGVTDLTGFDYLTTVSEGNKLEVTTLAVDDGSNDQGTIEAGPLSTDRTYTLPNEDGTFCLDSGNCAGIGSITSLNGQTNGVQSFATSTGGTDFNISSTGGIHTFNIPDASAANRGLITNGIQTIAGNKTLLGSTTIAASGGAALTLSGAATNAINITNTAVTNDIVLQNGETIQNNVDGIVNTNGNLSAGSGTGWAYGVNGTSAFGYSAWGRTTAGTASFASSVSGDSNWRYIVNADGGILWGSGIAAGDTNLYRGGLNQLATDDSLSVGANLEVTGTIESDGAIFGNGKEIVRSIDGWVRLNAAGDFTNGVYTGTTGALRTDGELQVGANGDYFLSSSAGVIVNETGLATDFRVEGDTDANLFRVDGSADSVGIGVASPDTKLDVRGVLTVGDGFAGTGFNNDNIIQLSSTTNTEQVGVELYVREGTNNRRSTLFVDDAAGISGINSTCSTVCSSFELQQSGIAALRALATENVAIGDAGTIDFATGNGDLYVEDELEVDGEINVGPAVTLSPANSTGTASDILFNGGGAISAEDSLYVNIDSDNDTIGGSFQVGKDSATSSATALFTVQESGDILTENSADSALDFALRAGDTVSQQTNIKFQDFNGTDRWYIQKSASNQFAVQDRTGTTALNRIELQAGDGGNSTFRTGRDTGSFVFRGGTLGNEELLRFQSNGDIIFEGNTDNTNEITLAIQDPGADYTVTLPAETGTICTTAASAACVSAYAGGGGSSLFTDGGATTYLTATGDNLAVGVSGGTVADSKLHVEGNSGTPVQIRVSNAAASGDSEIIFEETGQGSNFAITYDGGNNELEFSSPQSSQANLLVIERDGSGVGIGTNAPSAELQVAGSTIIDSDLAVNGGDITSTQGTLRINAAGTVQIQDNAQVDGTLNVLGSVYDSAGSLTLDDNVGITGSLDVRGSISDGGDLRIDFLDQLRVDESGSSYDVWIQGGSATSGDNRNLAILGEDEDSGDQLHVNYGGEYAGNLIVAGITTTVSDTELYVVTAAASNGAQIGNAFIGNGTTSTNAQFSHDSYRGSGSNYALLQSSGGATYLNSSTGNPLYLRVGNTTYAQVNPAGQFDVTNNILVGGHIQDDGSSNRRLDLDVGGSVQLRFATGDDYINYQSDENWVYYRDNVAVWTYSGGFISDQTLKKNVVEIPNALDKLSQIRGVTYNWKNENGISFGSQTEVGVIAQEIEAVLPELVTTDPVSGYKNVQYERLTALLIEGVNDQQGQIQALQNQIANQSFTGLNQVSATNITATDLTVTGTATINTLVVTGDAQFDGNLIVAGTTEVQDIIVNGKIVTAGDVPTYTVLDGAGEDGLLPSDPTVEITLEGNDIAGTITIKTGVNTVLDDVLEVAFDEAYSTGATPRIITTPVNAEAVTSGVFLDIAQADENGFVLGTVTQLADDTEYIFNYLIVE